MSGPGPEEEDLQADALFALGEELRRLRDEPAAWDTTIMPGPTGGADPLAALGARHGVESGAARDVAAAIEALDVALGEDTPDASSGSAPDAGPPVAAPPGYELVRELGQGGMGVVWRARHLALGRDVALKVLRPAGHLAELVDRFEREARLLAKLRHPHIVAVHEVGRSDSGLFFTMDLVEGTSLAALLAREGRLNPTRAARLVGQVADAIAYTHSRGLVHRDLKPGNVLVDEGGEAFVVDFGLARELAAGSDVTRTGQLLGTPAYMSPEQAAGRPATEASDVYALGAILHEALSGRRVHEGRTLAATLHAVLHDDPRPLRSLVPDLPRDLETIALRALARDPARRYPTAQAFREDLERWAQGVPILARPATALEKTRAWARRRPALALVLGQLGLVGLVLLGLGARALRDAVERRRQEAVHAAERDRRFDEELEARLQASLPLAEAGDLRAQESAGKDLVLGAGPVRDVARGLEYLRRAAEANLGTPYGADLDTARRSAATGCAGSRSTTARSPCGRPRCGPANGPRSRPAPPPGRSGPSGPWPGCRAGARSPRST